VRQAGRRVGYAGRKKGVKLESENSKGENWERGEEGKRRDSYRRRRKAAPPMKRGRFALTGDAKPERARAMPNAASLNRNESDPLKRTPR
jgi:hypothetical protein